MKLSKLHLVVPAIILFATISVLAQTQPNLLNGIPPQGSYDGSNADTINLLNGNVALHIPLPVATPQRGKLAIKYYLVTNSKTWQAMSPDNQWRPSYDCSSGGPCGQGPVFVSTASFTMTRSYSEMWTDSGTHTWNVSPPETLVTWDGASHPFGIGATGLETADTSRYNVQISGSDANGLPYNGTVTDANGTQYSGTFTQDISTCVTDPGNGLPGWTATRNCNEHFSVTSVTDANGNVLTAPMGIPDIGGVFGIPSVPTHQAVGSESTGCQTALGTPWVAYLNYPAPNGQTNQIKLCFAPFPKLSTNFSPAGIHQYQYLFNNNPSSQPVPIFLSNVILPDNTQWSINYDTYGEITSVTTPTTATMQYAWAEGSYPICSNADITTVSRAVHKRTLTDVNGNAFSWTYQWGAQASDGTISHTVTDPLGNDTVHVFKSIAQQTNIICNFLEISTRTYQGPVASVQQMKQVDTAYLVPVDYNNVVPQDETATIFPSGKVSKVHTDYDQGFGSGTSATLGLPTAQKTYDWGPSAPGALLQEVDTAYLWQSDSRYVTAHLLNLPAAATTRDGSGCKMAETDYTYDEAAYLTSYENTVGALPAGTHVATPNAVRGNPTSLTRQQFASNACPTTPQSGPTSHTNWYDTGEVYKQIDPLGNISTHSYDLAYAGALPTNACNAKNQCVNATYDINTGLLATFTDANNQTSSYNHDFMSRATSALAPPDPSNGYAQAQTTLTYSAANTLPLSVQRQTSVTTALADTATSYLDGLGHTSQSKHVVTGGTAMVNISFDGLGHAVTVTNPFFTTSDPTYGVTTSQYDALGRLTQVTKQDGSISTVSYSDNCITVTDEAGKPHKTCSDAMGRLIEVDEPQASDLGTNATANITVSGAINSVSSGSPPVAVSGSAVTSILWTGSNSPQNIFYLSIDRHVRWLYADVNRIWHDQDLTASAGAAAGVSGTRLTSYLGSSSNPLNVIYLTSDQHVHQLYSDAQSHWHDQDNTALAGAPVAAVGSALTSYFWPSASYPQNVFYLTTNGHIHALVASTSGAWSDWDISNAAGATSAATGTALTSYFWSGTGYPQNVFYTTTDGHVHQLYADLSGVWRDWNNTSAAGAPLAVSGTTLSSYLWSGASYPQNAFYQTSDGHIHTLAANTGGVWGDWDITGLSGAPTAVTGTALATYVWSGASYPQNAFYQTSNGHVHTLAANTSGAWGDWDITSLAGAPTAATGTALSAYLWSGSNTPQNVAYIAADGHVHALYADTTGAWHDLNLSTIASENALDAGIVTLSVSGFTATACFGSSTNSACTGQPENITPAQTATALAQALNVPASPVTASVSGAAINMTWKTAGPFTPPIAALVTTHDQPGVFSSPSFTSPAASFSGGAGPSLTNNPYVTLYQYDALGNLLRVDQKGSAPSDSTKWRTRTFTYDSLSRLITANNPESGSICYGTWSLSGNCVGGYDADGNLLQKTSLAPNQTGSSTQTISYCYDSLNRVTGKAYSAQTCTNGQLPAGTAVVSYVYDQGANAVGKLSSFTDQAGSGSYTYDALGRISSEQRMLVGSVNVTNTLSYSYNLNGSVKTITYPSGAVVTYAPDSAGRMLSTVDNGHSINYVTGATYGPDSALTGFISGNSSSFAGINNTFSFNNRLQPCRMTAGTGTMPSVCNDANQAHIGNIFDVSYDFHIGNGTTGSDNGNVWGIINNKDATRSQAFTYDALNRLTSAQNTGTDCSVTVLNGKTKFWGNSYSYDAWGNLLTKAITKCSPENLTLISNAQNRADNGLPLPQNYNYDAAGNMTLDPTDLVAATYDSENRIATATKSNVTTTYTYDDGGSRVKKTNGGTGTLYWYMGSEIVAESDLAGNLTTEYVFFDGERVARRNLPTGNVSYYFSDHLKTASVITDASGTILDESDYYPWGGELQFTNNLDNHYKFTGKERDSETGLDYFGARYYSNGLGRFITPDWAAKATAVPYADFADPQSLNLYTYVRDTPTTRFDEDGHQLPTLQEDDGKKRLAIKKPSDCPGLSECKPGDATDLTPQGRQNVQTVIGFGKEISNEFKGLMQSLFLGQMMINPANWKDSLDAINLLNSLVPDWEASNSDQARAMKIAFVAMLFIPILGEEGAANKLEGKVAQDVHHLLPQEKALRAIFESLGLDIEKYTIKMNTQDHRLKPNGIHTKAGGNWNKVWREFLTDPKNRTVPRVMQQLEKMMKDFGIR